MLISFEQLVSAASQAVDQVWESEWRRADFCMYMTSALTKSEVKKVMNQIGRSHEDAYRWAELARAFPIHNRCAQCSPREHTRMYNKTGIAGLCRHSPGYEEEMDARAATE